MLSRLSVSNVSRVLWVKKRYVEEERVEKMFIFKGNIGERMTLQID